MFCDHAAKHSRVSQPFDKAPLVTPPMIQLILCCPLSVCLQRGALPSQADLFQRLFEAAIRYHLYLPTRVFTSSALPSLLQLASAVLRNQERLSCRAVLTFLFVVLTPPMDRQPQSMEAWQKERRPVLDHHLQQYGKPLVAALLYSATDTVAHELIRSCSTVLHSILGFYQANTALTSDWIVAALSDPLFPGSVCGAIGESEKRLFCQVAARQPPFRKMRFDAFFSDFANACRREGTPDALLAYEV
eukprot:TRINITY_DN358_c0_g1_i4.p1 TRINITY_DN358_c0_g1~~TRINITY_DN358_c0_g1_i4.p1  ORF type:complete len:246 (+),score=19.45 TRINITY_DN358_c0_g1_i4:171-908(+)